MKQNRKLIIIIGAVFLVSISVAFAAMSYYASFESTITISQNRLDIYEPGVGFVPAQDFKVEINSTEMYEGTTLSNWYYLKSNMDNNTGQIVITNNNDDINDFNVTVKFDNVSFYGELGYPFMNDVNFGAEGSYHSIEIIYTVPWGAENDNYFSDVRINY
jgi:hypothetical protein